MNSISHDPSEYIRGIQQVLISDKKRIYFLVGAGNSLAKNSSKTLTVPAITKLTTEIINIVSKVKEKYGVALNEIKA